MATSPPLPSALDAKTQAFPVLPESLIERVRSSGRVRQVERGEILFEPSDPFGSVLRVALGEHGDCAAGVGREIHPRRDGPRNRTLSKRNAIWWSSPLSGGRTSVRTRGPC